MTNYQILPRFREIFARIYWKTRCLKRLRLAFIIITISAIAAFCGLVILETIFAPRVIGDSGDIRLSVPINVSSSGYFEYNETVDPGYFWSSANAYVYMCSPYAGIFNFTLEYSVDNSSSWIEVPIAKGQAIPQDLNQYTTVGSFSIDKPTTLRLYGRYELPSQNVPLPAGVTANQILRSLHGQIVFAAPRNAMLEILVFITLFSLSLSIIRFLKDEWCKETNKTGLQ
ncbi:MAG: hypothetical protein NWE93_02490 [Candidatus Bathyarchaeota archaeon]|nr:hypothetical protein [Candidatus Bathyarchaeota archaeon]